MRVESVPIAPRLIAVSKKPDEVTARVKALVEDDWKQRILDADHSGLILITAPYHFNTETGFGQPAGGRKYYTQLRIEIKETENGTSVQLSHYNFEIRTSYAYNKDGQLGTMYKHYPYEEYPGMFDLNLINQEMDRVAAELKQLFQGNGPR